MGLDHPLVGIEWIVTFILMIIVIHLRERGYRPASLYGLMLGGIVSYGFGYFGETPLNFNVDSFMYMLLPPIVLQSGLNFKWDHIKNSWGTALSLAWFGTCITAAWVGYAVYISHDINHFILALWLGAILGPTDAVSTRESVKDLNHKTKMVLEYESILNDAASIMIVHICQQIWFNSLKIDSKDIVEIIGFNILLLFVSIFTGILCAYIASKTIENTTVVFSLALLSYAFCECIRSSGIISIFSFGIMFQYMSAKKYLKEIKIISKSFSEFAEVYIYISIGVIVILTEFKYIMVGFTVILACFTSRIFSVFMVTFLSSFIGTSYSCLDKITMSISGVRGALSLTLALSAPPHMKEIFITATTIELLFSMFCVITWSRILIFFSPSAN